MQNSNKNTLQNIRKKILPKRSLNLSECKKSNFYPLYQFALMNATSGRFSWLIIHFDTFLSFFFQFTNHLQSLCMPRGSCLEYNVFARSEASNYCALSHFSDHFSFTWTNGGRDNRTPLMSVRTQTQRHNWKGPRFAVMLGWMTRKLPCFVESASLFALASICLKTSYIIHQVSSQESSFLQVSRAGLRGRLNL